MSRETLRLRTQCPQCGARPAVHVHRDRVELFDDSPPEKPVLSIQCQRCSHIYDVTARAFQRAS